MSKPTLFSYLVMLTYSGLLIKCSYLLISYHALYVRSVVDVSGNYFAK